MTTTSWKDKSYNQVSAVLQKTTDTNDNLGTALLFKARPIKHAYRRELPITSSLDTGNPRIAASIRNSYEVPNGFFTDTTEQSCQGITDQYQTTENELVQNCGVGCLDETNCSTNSVETSCINAEMNALKRVRSGGMIRKKFDESRGNDKAYFTDRKQYMISRNLTIEQNNYSYIRQGDPTSNPGSSQSQTNIYSAQGLSHCKRAFISPAMNNNIFSYVWLDGQEYSVVIPTGYYDVFSFNEAFRSVMITNLHYYIQNLNLSKHFLLNFAYNTNKGRIELQAFENTVYSLSQYAQADGWTITQSVPQFVFPATSITTLLGGVGAGTFPSTPSTTFYFTLPERGTLQPPYSAVYYKPNNTKFAIQGSVSGAEYVQRKKYDTVTNQGYANRESWGSSVANALAYNVQLTGNNLYTWKQRVGYPNAQHVRFKDGALVNCIFQREI